MRVGAGSVGGCGTWNLLEAPALGGGPVSWDPPPQWSSGCRGVLTCTHACFMDVERRPRGPDPEGSREPTASASADPAVAGCLQALQPGSGVSLCLRSTRGASRDTGQLAAVLCTRTRQAHTPSPPRVGPCSIPAHTGPGLPLRKPRLPTAAPCPTCGWHTSILPSAIWAPEFPTVSPRRRSFVGSLRQ